MEEIKLGKVKVKWGAFPKDYYMADLYMRYGGGIKVFLLGDRKENVEMCNVEIYNACVPGRYQKEYFIIPKYLLG